MRLVGISGEISSHCGRLVEKVLWQVEEGQKEMRQFSRTNQPTAPIHLIVGQAAEYSISYPCLFIENRVAFHFDLTLQSKQFKSRHPRVIFN